MNEWEDAHQALSDFAEVAPTTEFRFPSHDDRLRSRNPGKSPAGVKRGEIWSIDRFLHHVLWSPLNGPELLSKAKGYLLTWDEESLPS